MYHKLTRHVDDIVDYETYKVGQTWVEVDRIRSRSVVVAIPPNSRSSEVQAWFDRAIAYADEFDVGIEIVEVK